MRVLIHIEFPLEPFNTYVRDGSIGAKVQKILEATKPEAAYFTEKAGKRGATIVANLESASDLPAQAEPWFLTLNAHAEFRIAMTPEDLGKANLAALGKQW